MNLEQIDTSTTAGKAEVMRLAAEGSRVASRPKGLTCGFSTDTGHVWNWQAFDFAIISEPVGPEEMFVVMRADGTAAAVCDTSDRAKAWNGPDLTIVRYRRSDLPKEAA